MKTSMKRLLCFTLCLVMCMTLLPVEKVRAEDGLVLEPETAQTETPTEETPAPEETSTLEQPTAPPSPTPTAAPESTEEPAEDQMQTAEATGDEVRTPEATPEPTEEPAASEKGTAVMPSASPAASQTQAEDTDDALPAPVKVVFDLTPEDASLTVYVRDEQGEKTVFEPEKDGSYRLVPGQYRYDLVSEGHEAVENEGIEIRASDLPVEVKLTLTVSDDSGEEIEPADGSSEAGSNGEPAEDAADNEDEEQDPVQSTEEEPAAPSPDPEDEETLTPEPEEDPDEASETDAKPAPGTVITCPGETYEFELDDDALPDDLFESYVKSVFYPEQKNRKSGLRKADTTAGSKLTGVNAVLYTLLREQITLVASGERTSTEFTFPLSELNLEKTEWTAAELGVTAIVDDNGTITTEAKKAVNALLPVGYGLVPIMRALLADCPFELYWFNKIKTPSVRGYDFTARYDDEWVLTISGSYSYSFPVVSEYGGGYAVDPSTGETVHRAAANAAAIVAEFSHYSNMEKLTAYKDRICAMTSYNHAAAGTGNENYGNPWQLIWVFDGDPETEVVCEGYAKAFKYLCDLSEFTGNVKCITAEGRNTNTPSTPGEAHMWNVVTMPDGNRWLVDVTFCDSAKNDMFYFMVGCYDGDVETGYYFFRGDYFPEIYIYDSMTMFDVYSREELTITYSPDPYNIDWSFNNGVLTMDGEGPMIDFTTLLPPWQTYESQIREIVIGEGFLTSGKNYGRYPMLQKITLPESMREIEDKAFISCSRLASIEIPSGIKTIGDYAFYNCSGLKTVVLHEGLESIGCEAFAECTSLKSISFPSTLRRIEEEAFMRAPLETVTFREGLEYIGSGAFFGAGITSLNLPSTLTQIGELDLENNGAFAGCYYLISVTLPSSLRILGAYTFRSCQRLKTVVFNEGLTAIGAKAFEDCFSLASVTLPASLQRLDSPAFNCSNGHVIQIKVDENNPYFNFSGGALYNTDRTVLLSFSGSGSFRVPNGVTAIADFAFAGSDIYTVYLPEGLQSIGDNAFYDSDLSMIYGRYKGKDVQDRLPDSLVSIGAHAFEGMHLIDSVIRVPAGVTEIGQSAFKNRCAGIVVDSENAFYMSYDGVLYDKSGETLLECPINNPSLAKSALKFYPGVKRIGERAFQETSASSITFPDTVESIGSGAFFGSTLKQVTFGKGITEIGEQAFSASLLRKVSFPENANLRSIGAYAFNETKIDRIIFPSGLESIDRCCLFNCAELKLVCFPQTLASMGESVFSGDSKLNTVIYCGPPPQRQNGFWGTELPYGCESVTIVYLRGYQAQWLPIIRNCEEGGNGFSFCMLDVNSAPTMFDDTADASQYFFAPVYWAKELGITSGKTPTTFEPYSSCTRGQIVTFLWRMMGQPEPTDTANPFKDVKESDYFCKAVLWAKEKGITSGKTATTFEPYAACTREQCVTFLWRAAGKPSANVGTQFKDVKRDAYYAEAVYWALAKGITTGQKPNAFGVGNKCTRGQIVTFLYRYAKLTGIE